MQRVIVNIDVVDSTKTTEMYGDEEADKRIGSTLLLAKNALSLADPTIEQDGPQTGDGILLFGNDPIEIYRAAERYQALYRCWPYVQLPVKITLGYGEVERNVDESGFKNSRGRKLNHLYRIASLCPRARVVVTPDMFSILETARYAHRFVPFKAELKGIEGMSTYYLSRWEYENEEDRVAPAYRQETSNEDRRQVNIMTEDIKPKVASVAGISVYQITICVTFIIVVCWYLFIFKPH